MGIAVIGVPFNTSGVPGGEAPAPRRLWEAGLLTALAVGGHEDAYPPHPSLSGEAADRAGRRIWLHLDLDVLTSDALPAVSYLQPVGLDWDELDAVGRLDP